MTVVKIPTLRELTPLQELQRDVLGLGQDHVRMMADPNLWSQWPYLPLRRKPKDNEKPHLNLPGFGKWMVGFLLATDDCTKFYVFLGNFIENSILRKTERYTSYEEIVAVGWEVD